MVWTPGAGGSQASQKYYEEAKAAYEPEPYYDSSGGSYGGGEREEETHVPYYDDPVDYTTPVDTGQGDTGSNISTVNDIVEEPIDGRSAAIQASQEEKRLRDIQQLKSLYASTMSSPAALGGALYEGLDLGTIFGKFGADPTAMKATDEYGNVIKDKYGEPVPHSSMEYGNMPSEGQIPITDWDKLNFLHHLGIGTNETGKEGLGAFFAVDEWGDAILDSSGNLIKTGLGNTMSDKFNEIVYGTPSTFNPEEQLSMEEQFEKAEEDYWTGREQDWDSWTDPWHEGYYQGEADSMSDLARHYWFSESLDDVTARKEERRKAGLGAAGMRASEMEQMYDKDFAAMADPHHDPGYSETITSELDPIYASKLLWETARME